MMVDESSSGPPELIYCLICNSTLKSSSHYEVSSTRTIASNSVLAFKIFDILTLECLSGVLCKICHDLVDQIDVFQQNIQDMKQQLLGRQEDEAAATANAKIFLPSKGKRRGPGRPRGSTNKSKSPAATIMESSSSTSAEGSGRMEIKQESFEEEAETKVKVLLEEGDWVGEVSESEENEDESVASDEDDKPKKKPKKLKDGQAKKRSAPRKFYRSFDDPQMQVLEDCRVDPEKFMFRSDEVSAQPTEQVANAETLVFLEQSLQQKKLLTIREITNVEEMKDFDLVDCKRYKNDHIPVRGDKFCFACNTEFPNYSNRLTHYIATHCTRDELYSCQRCDCHFSDDAKGMQHMLTMHQQVRKENQCRNLTFSIRT